MAKKLTIDEFKNRLINNNNILKQRQEELEVARQNVLKAEQEIYDTNNKTNNYILSKLKDVWDRCIEGVTLKRVTLSDLDNNVLCVKVDGLGMFTEYVNVNFYECSLYDLEQDNIQLNLLKMKSDRYVVIASKLNLIE